ncbi:MAG TPA: DUF5662 family protein, partial [Nitrospira sp.]|nr:DUF5662 family protein [Nitrospira sp.]
MGNYDSTGATLEHIGKVRELLLKGMVSDLIHRMRTDADILTELINRVMEHDLSKLEAPEKELYDKYTPVLAKLTYGTPEYRQNLEEMGEALR